jgi:replicative DNA helicase
MISQFVTSDPSDFTDEEAERIVREKQESDAKKSDSNSPTTPAIDILDPLFNRIASGTMPKLFRLGPALDGIEIGYGLVCTFGGPPGGGKTTLVMQVMAEALEYQSDLRVVVANRESPMEVLLQRELARRSGVHSRAIRFGDCKPKQLQAIKVAVDELRPLLERVSSLNEPGELPMLKRLLTEKPGLLILDYIQKFAPSGEVKAGVTEVMTTARQFARAGWGVLALSATARTQTKNRSSQDSQQLNLASFRDSSEIEYQSDAAYLIVDNEGPDSEATIRKTTIQCVKNRHGEKTNKVVNFNMPQSRFEPVTHQEFDQYANTNISDTWGAE